MATSFYAAALVSGKRILFIDDEKDFTILVSTLFGFHNLEVDALSDSQQVAGQIAKARYDAVVTDLMMPGLDGFGVIRLIRQHPDFQKTPLIVLSARTLSDEERKFLLQNDVHFVMKPFDPQGLVDQIRGLTSAT